MGRGLKGEVRFIDLCAGLGGFHQALKYAERSGPLRKKVHFKCVLASELDADLRALYMKNFPEMVDIYNRLYPKSAWRNRQAAVSAALGTLAESLDVFGDSLDATQVHGDLNALVDEPNNRIRRWPDGKPMIPEHDLLCAGFPCQPFSKSGAQRGFDDVDGTVFHLISIILKERRPGFVLLENVGNFERHDKGNTWKRVKEILHDLGYEFRATTHVGSTDGGEGLLSPHHVGFPHHRERFFIVAKHKDERRIPDFETLGSPFPERIRNETHPGFESNKQKATKALSKIIASSGKNTGTVEFAKAKVASERLRCAEHWQLLLKKIAQHDREVGHDLTRRIQPIPSFPIWGFELDIWNQYPINTNPQGFLKSRSRLNKWRRKALLSDIKKLKIEKHAPTGDRAYLAKATFGKAELKTFRSAMPAYAIDRDEWPTWKRRYLEQNRTWALKLWANLDGAWLREWLNELYTMTPSHQKFEWNCQGDPLNVWKAILQFRPSGLRAKRFAHVPALVAMTTTQIPVVPRGRNEPEMGVGPSRRARHLLPKEALQLQGFPSSWHCLSTRDKTFQALGNAVHAGLVGEIFKKWLGSTE